MFSKAEWITLIDKLARLTQDEKIEWDAVGLEHVSVSVGRITYNLRTQDADGTDPFILTVFRGAGDEALEIGTLTSNIAANSEQEPEGRLRDLWPLALRSSLGGPSLVKDIFDDLDALDSDEF
ncbi:hypothetical protein [Pseudoclavibacter terrae]|uniref:hypothetical protein n=1 Tax=Pseudoclavibacter terrae TaxID=1530195 RepID=UPI00232F60B4|nr:hypothetical protein [Pseudoclavibacter terrae]